MFVSVQRNAKEGQQTTVTTSTENYGVKREQTIRPVERDSFYFEKELQYPAARKAEKRTEACDEKSCNDTCSKQAQNSDHDIYRGWCDPKGSCRCYHRDLCHADSCQNTCEEKHMNETNLTYECKDQLCVCKWNRKCNITGCEETCNDIYAGKPNIEWWCEDIKCKCRWHGATPTITHSGAARVPSGVFMDPLLHISLTLLYEWVECTKLHAERQVVPAAERRERTNAATTSVPKARVRAKKDATELALPGDHR
ncbi:hypothetical protein HPB51_027876 [Rhipicephalus microplus]|uniref:Uncharacterized protein n=1 Tax=Rhipicephalus microplus TaxID=6941 RepID=A0A9J6CYR1_RHIMP|nr:hypothetical protein HPB51_027876 [Rhipicephalus microplus]